MPSFTGVGCKAAKRSNVTDGEGRGLGHVDVRGAPCWHTGRAGCHYLYYDYTRREWCTNHSYWHSSASPTSSHPRRVQLHPVRSWFRVQEVGHTDSRFRLIAPPLPNPLPALNYTAQLYAGMYFSLASSSALAYYRTLQAALPTSAGLLQEISLAGVSNCLSPTRCVRSPCYHLLTSTHFVLCDIQ